MALVPAYVKETGTKQHVPAHWIGRTFGGATFQHAPGSAPPAEDAPDPDVEPPRSGAGSGAQAWRDYAASQGVGVEQDATRDDIIAVLDARQS